MKLQFFLLFACSVITANAQTSVPAEKTMSKHTLPVVTLKAAKLSPEEEWRKSTASQIPLKSHTPYYENEVKYGHEFTKDEIDEKASYYFTKVFGSRSYSIESEKHNYTGYGNYLFCADKKVGTPALYKVYYRVNISVKTNKYYVELYDFTLENQHSEVSFAYLMKNAKNNDAQSRRILEIFHNINQEELNKIYATMSGENHNAASTASIESGLYFGESRQLAGR